MDNLEVLQKPEMHSSNKIYDANSVKSIIFNENNIVLDNESTLEGISLMIPASLFWPHVIEMILPEGVTHPKSQKIYLSYDIFAQSLYYNSTEVYFYYENGYVRNATLGFNFTGNWENVEDFELKLLLTNKKDKQFIDVSGIPSNIKYSLEYDDILTFLPKEEEGGGGSGSAGIRMRNITSCALIMVLIATIFAVI